MINLRRAKIKSGTYFFTVTLRDRRMNFLTQYVHTLIFAMRKVCDKFPFKTHAIVILPNHLHVIWELPQDDNNYYIRWCFIKKYFTQSLLVTGMEIKKDNRGDYFLWRPRIRKYSIRNAKDFEKHVNYIHNNPVKHHLVSHPEDWPYSSFHRFNKQNAHATLEVPL